MKYWLRKGLAILAILWSIPSWGIEFMPMSIAELTAKSDWVVQGRVLAKTCHEDASGRVYTRVEIEVAEVWKGPAQPALIQVVHGGGTLGKKRVVVQGQAQYQTGEEIVAFLVINPRGEPVTLGLAQGKFQVWTDSTTGNRLAANLFHGIHPGGSAAELRQVKTADRLTVASLKRQVQGGVR